MRGMTRTAIAACAAVVLGLGGTAAAQAGNAGKVLICHGTASDTNPYVLISVSANAADTHLGGHGQNDNHYPDYLLPANQTVCTGYPGSEGPVE